MPRDTERERGERERERKREEGGREGGREGGERCRNNQSVCLLLEHTSQGNVSCYIVIQQIS